MIGIDIVSISRISKIYTKFGDKFLDKILSGNEQNSVLNLNDNLKLERLAGIYAAKEAFAKALGVGISADFGFLDVEILKNDRGAPFLEIAPCIIKKFNIKNANVSITHDGGFAISAVILEMSKF